MIRATNGIESSTFEVCTKFAVTATNKIYFVISCIALEVFTGIAMYYFDFPFLSQPFHLVIATIIIGVQFYILLECRSKKEKIA